QLVVEFTCNVSEFGIRLIIWQQQHHDHEKGAHGLRDHCNNGYIEDFDRSARLLKRHCTFQLVAGYASGLPVPSGAMCSRLIKLLRQQPAARFNADSSRRCTMFCKNKITRLSISATSVVSNDTLNRCTTLPIS